MSERDANEILEQIRQTTGARLARRVSIGRGAKATIGLPAGAHLETTMNSFFEGVHFDLAHLNARELGQKTLAATFIDLAASGAAPRHVQISLALPQTTSEIFLTELFRGFRDFAKQHDVDISSGKSVPSPALLAIQLVAFGQRSLSKPAAKPIPRTARLGDLIAVTGTLGDSAAGLACLRRLGRYAMVKHPELLEAHVTPEPPIEAALSLWRNPGMTSMLDLVDGLASEVNVLAERSNLGACLREAALPLSKSSERAGELITSNPKLWALYGPEDYQLLITLKPSAKAAIEKTLKAKKTTLTIIGEMTPKKEGVRIETVAGDTNPLPPKGWHHFVRRR